MKKNHLTSSILSILLTLSTFSCVPAGDVTTTPTPCPATQTPLATFHPTPVHTKPALPTRAVTPQPDTNRLFLDSLPANPESCLPGKTTDDLGIYIYDLDNERELISINADVPLQFASAFKAPVLVYFLSACRQYWDPSSAEWQEYFKNRETAQNIDLFVSPAYREIVALHISDSGNWDNIGNFFAANRQTINGAGGAIDVRYFVLDQVFGMIVQSGNLATAEVLQFTFDNCLDAGEIVIESQCGGPNPITAFNAWFNDFANIPHENGAPRRGLYRWDVIMEGGEDASQETVMPTSGQEDKCVNQKAILNCDPANKAFNTFSARDLFKFYNTLYHLKDEPVRNAAFRLLSIDQPGPARGNLKNLARSMQAEAISKNGHAYFSHGSINNDAGIVLYQGRAFIVITLSFNALGPMGVLYGSYDSEGAPLKEPGLIQNLLEKTANPP